MSVKTGENVFTRKYDKLMFRYPVKVVLGTGENEEIVEGVIDTGSPVCGVTKRLADKFGLKKLGATSVSPAFGGKSERMLYCVDFLLEDCLRFSDMRATEIEKGYDGAEFIVGCNVLCLGDFVITNLRIRHNIQYASQRFLAKVQKTFVQCFLKHKPPFLKNILSSDGKSSCRILFLCFPQF